MDIRDVRKLYSIRTVLGVTKKSIVCPLPMHRHENNTPSFSIFWKDGVEYFKCHGNCQKMGDVIDLVGYLNIPSYDDKSIMHIMMAISMLVDGHEVTIVKPQKKIELPPTKYLEYLPISDDGLMYLSRRGLTRSTIEHFKVGSGSNSISIPIFENKNLIGIKFRSLNGSGLRYWSEKGSRTGVFNHDDVCMLEEPILVLKAEIPAMLAWQAGFKACGMTGGEMSLLDKYRYLFSFSSRVIYVTDNDRDPKIRARILERAIENAKAIRADVKHPPSEFKDWDEWYLADSKDCIGTTRRWLNENENKES